MGSSQLLAPTKPSERKREPVGGELDLTSLVDVVFLLLIFFMISSTMTSQSDVDVPVAKKATGVDVEFATFITMLAPTEPNGVATIILGDGKGETGDLDDVRRYVERGLSEGRKDVIIKAEKKAPHRDVMDVARTVAAVEGAELFIGVQELP